MSKRFTRKFLFLPCLGLTALFVGGAYATWQYHDLSPTPFLDKISVELKDFNWLPETVLPDEENIGASHLQLIESIINHTQYGLNKSNSVLNNAIKKRQNEGKDTIGSMGVVQGGNLKHLFETEATNALEFVIGFSSDAEYYIYTFTDDDLNKANKEGVSIPVFRTLCEKENGKWVAKTSSAGNADTMYYDASQGKRSLSIDVETWLAS